MSSGSKHAAKLRERLTVGTEDKLGRALAELIDNPLVSGTIGRAFDARERATQAQELALSALNIPTAADIERLTRRLRSVSQRLEGIEDGVHRINRALSDGSVERRLVAVEEQLRALGSKLSGEPVKSEGESTASRQARKPSSPKRAASKAPPSRSTGPAKSTSPKSVATGKQAKRKASTTAKGKQSPRATPER